MHVFEPGVLYDSQMYFHTPSNMAKSMFFYLKCAGEYFCNNEYVVERDTFNSYLLMYIRKGSGMVAFEGKNYAVKENEVVLLNCHKPHAYGTDTGWEALWIHYDGNMSQQFNDLLYNRIACVVPLGDSTVIPRSLKLIVDGFRLSRPVAEPVVSCYIQRMLTEILMISSNTKDPGLSKDGAILDTASYIEANYREKLTLEVLAANANLSVYHFSRLFKKETGYSPYEYILRTRINQAKELLKNTSLSVKQIAYEVGFNSESNFVYTFHKSAHMTPVEFRKTPI